jgi:flotillin
MVTEQLPKLVEEQVKAVGNLKIDKVTVWDSGKGGADGKTSTAGFLSGLAGAIPPIHELARNAGVELPAFLGKTSETPPQPSSSGDQPEPQI